MHSCTGTWTRWPVPVPRGAVQGRERRYGGIDPGQHEVELAEGLERRRVDIAGRGDGAAEGARDEVRRKVVCPGPSGPKDETSTTTSSWRRRSASDNPASATANAPSQASTMSARSIRRLSWSRPASVPGSRAKNRRDDAKKACQRELVSAEPLSRCGPRRRSGSPSGGSGRTTSAAEVGQQLGAVDAAFVGEVDDANVVQRALGHETGRSLRRRRRRRRHN